jgi:hypothetical protein
MTPPEVSGRKAACVCAFVLGAFALVIINWRAAIGIRSSSSNVDLIVFSLAVTILPLVLLWSARRLTKVYSVIVSGVALCMLVFSTLVWLWSSQGLGRMARGFEVQPLLLSIPFERARIAAYEVETAPAGAYVALRLQHRIIPGLFVSREFAVIDTPVIDKLTLSSHAQLCVTFPSLEGEASSRVKELEAVLPVEPLFRGLAAPTLVEPDDASVAGSVADCKGV